MFNFLWRVKRVEFAITGAWRRAATGARGVLAGVDDVLGADWKKVRVGCAEMIHFLVQLQYYILFEVPPTKPKLSSFQFLPAFVYFDGICGETLMAGD